ncbi:hypothetical protein GM661_04200 [Iocasia frigidifontis]|uniref:Cellobiose phosphorylase n=1 Tax=Iocasia fonsfrigidae TaxID=2682810 RepID=A0A8A7KAX3_9FIRM|nr:hypothetical protein [Iocasia fonsfrigidae]QTL97235.1 hypothetical protein GM661_04200 [Iocasia fonsfrigidae]
MKIDESGNFIIENYQKQRTFSSFLPGIAGKFGIPIWAFYVNRGQGVASFGIENKDNAILEFLPANKSYQSVTYKGFRTFIKFKDNYGNVKIYEPFTKINQKINNKMIIAPHCLTIEEIDNEYQLAIKIKYFILPNENFGSLIRRISLKNLAMQEREVEILDGLPEVIPYGLSNTALKEVSQTMAAWCRVYNLENKIPLYRVKATTADSPEVHKIVKGHFCLFYTDKNNILTPLVDPEVIFGEDTSFQIPINFIDKELSDYQGEQMTENRFPSAMSAYKVKIEGGLTTTLNSLFGHVANENRLIEIKELITQGDYLVRKEKESEIIHHKLTDNIFTKSNIPEFDYYCCQTYLDNLLRGGFPINIGQGGKINHIYSRKHGDLERDYNFFHLEASYYSQGNGNYRDINQNRRSDNFFNPQVKDHNIKTFANLIQADGYNPLVIKGKKYYLTQKAREEVIGLVSDDYQDLLHERLKKSFTPGELTSFINDYNIKLNIGLDQFIETVITLSYSTIEAEFGEGYWIDHWTYLLDLIENYLAIYPEKSNELFFNDDSYYFYDSYMKVKPRSDKYVLTDLGPRQLDAIVEVEEKRKLINSRKEKPYQLRNEYGKGKVYNTTLLVKLLSLVTNKMSTLDPCGIGIEMEANKPGWYDALNGLPGIFGSSTPETLELKRLVDYLLEILVTVNDDYKVLLPLEIYEFFTGLNNLVNIWLDNKDNFNYWYKASSLREKYREKVFYGFKGNEQEILVKNLIEYLEAISKKLHYSIKCASVTDYGIYSTYYYYIPIEYKKTDQFSKGGYPFIRVSKFEQVILPPFLEGQVRAMKVLKYDAVKELHEKVKHSELFDRKLKMYRLNGDLSAMPDDIGRARAFTPGWLENGSIWLHMEYKYLLELIKNQLYDEFFQALDDCLIAFQDPEIYGRSILENSSFIMSSSNPDEKNHGRGYIARLSGSTAEFLEIWTIIAVGIKPFRYENEKLVFEPKAILKTEFFTKEEKRITLNINEKKCNFLIPKNCFTSLFLGNTLLVYHNPDKINTFDNCKINSYRILTKKGEIIIAENSSLKTPCAEMLRNGELERIDIYLSEG